MSSSPSVIGSRRYSPGIMSGDILLPAFQVQSMRRLGYVIEDDFVAVPTRSGHMYRYKFATKPYEFPGFRDPTPVEEGDVLDDWMYEFEKLHNKLVDYIRRQDSKIIVVETDDEEFLYGVLVTVCALLGESETDWLIDHQFGEMYVIRHLDTLDLEG